MRRGSIRLVENELREMKRVELNRFRAYMDAKCGIRPKTLDEYLESLEKLGIIKIRGNEITYIGED